MGAAPTVPSAAAVPNQRIAPARQFFQAFLNLRQCHRTAHPLSTGAKFTRSLRTTQHQNAEEGDFACIEVIAVQEGVPVLRDAGARGMNQHSQLFLAQSV